MVMKKKGKILATKIHRKETHTNRYLNYESCHLQQQKQGVIISLLTRAALIKSPQPTGEFRGPLVKKL